MAVIWVVVRGESAAPRRQQQPRALITSLSIGVMGAWERWPSDVCVCICSSDADYSINLGSSSPDGRTTEGLKNCPNWKPNRARQFARHNQALGKVETSHTTTLASSTTTTLGGRRDIINEFWEFEQPLLLLLHPPSDYGWYGLRFNQTFRMVPNWSYLLPITKSGNSNSWIGYSSHWSMSSSLKHRKCKKWL